MCNQLRIVDLLPDSNVDFPRQQQIIDRRVQFIEILQVQGITIKTKIDIGSTTPISLCTRSIKRNLPYFLVARQHSEPFR